MDVVNFNFDESALGKCQASARPAEWTVGGV